MRGRICYTGCKNITCRNFSAMYETFENNHGTLSERNSLSNFQNLTRTHTHTNIHACTHTCTYPSQPPHTRPTVGDQLSGRRKRKKKKRGVATSTRTLHHALRRRSTGWSRQRCHSLPPPSFAPWTRSSVSIEPVANYPRLVSGPD